MIPFFKSFLFEIVLVALGYIAFALLSVLGRMTMKFGRAVFSR